MLDMSTIFHIQLDNLKAPLLSKQTQRSSAKNNSTYGSVRVEAAGVTLDVRIN
mgnify:CR=1 FL=1